MYAAHNPGLDRKVALKLLRIGPGDATGGGDLRTRLLREAQALAQLAHPCVVTDPDVGTLGDRVWIAMEFIAGVTLTQWLLQQPRRWSEVVAVMQRAGRGLAAAHAVGLVHRDFKPKSGPASPGAPLPRNAADLHKTGVLESAGLARGCPG